MGFNKSNGGDLKYELGIGPDRFERLYLTLGSSVQSDILISRILVNHVIKNGGLDHLFPREFKPVRVYLNGEDWGMYNMSHSDDNRYLESLIGISDNLITYLTYSDKDFDISAPDDPGKEEHYNNIVCPFIEAANFLSDSDYEKIWEYFNKRNYMDYVLVSAYMASGKLTRQRPYGDTVLDFGNNQDLIRMGQYYFLLGDQDETYQYLDRNELQEFAVLGKNLTKGYPPAILFAKLIKRDDFRDELLNRFSDMISTFLRPQIQKHVLDDIVEMLRVDWDSEVKRWNGQTILPYQEWDSLYRRDIERFMEDRGAIVRGQFIDLFPPVDTTSVKVEVAHVETCEVPGTIRISTLDHIDSMTRYSFTSPVKVPISGVSNQGFTFDYWELNGKTYSSNPDTIISFKRNQSHRLVAHFTGNPDQCNVRSKLIVNEIVASNTTTVEDKAGAWPDYVELYNPTTDTAYLGGLYVTDDAKDMFKYQLDDRLVISPKGYVLLFADGNGKLDMKPNHLDFKLSKKGEAFYLANINGDLISGTSFKNLETDRSLSFVEGKYMLCPPTPLKANHCQKGK